MMAYNNHHNVCYDDNYRDRCNVGCSKYHHNSDCYNGYYNDCYSDH